MTIIRNVIYIVSVNEPTNIFLISTANFFGTVKKPKFILKLYRYNMFIPVFILLLLLLLISVHCAAVDAAVGCACGRAEISFETSKCPVVLTI